jgi:hypothetical protein
VPLVNRLSNETVLTARAVADANRNGTLDDGDAAYRVDGAVVEANATVSPEPEPANGTTTVTNGTTTEPGNETAAPTTTQRSLDTEDSVPLTPNQAGGGGSAGGTMSLSPVLVAVALAAAAVLAGRQ